VKPIAGLDLEQVVQSAVEETKITDIHTHLFSPQFGDLLLWGIDELLTYHYLIAETFRYIDMPYESFWKMSKQEQADLVWKTLFVEHSPISEACRGVLTVLSKLGLDVQARDLSAYREYFRSKTVDEYVNIAFELAGIESAVMTNDPFDDSERPVWLSSCERDPRFKAVLRIDPLLNTFSDSYAKMVSLGYDVDLSMSHRTLSEIRRFLSDWISTMDPLYMAVSLPPSFAYPEDSVRGKIITECILPVCREHGMPFAMMIGVKKLVNPGLRLAGDSVGKSCIEAVERLCAGYPDNKFMVTMLARENQHELAVAARKYRNLLVFGCWWFLNNPSLIDEITRMRCELLGLSFVPQHSDARVLDQVIYKWAHSRRIIASILVEKYGDLANTGWIPTEAEIRRDVDDLFGGNFWSFVKR
jgi:hypothetical protein